MRLKRLTIFELLFPLTAISFIGLGVTLISEFVSYDLRWYLTVALATYLFCNRRMLCFSQSSYILIFCYLLWCLSTVLWSNIPSLSLYKALAALLTVTSLVAAGRHWVMMSYHRNVLGWGALILVVALIAGTPGLGGASQSYASSSITLYQGLTNNPNMLGILGVMGLPLALWQFHKHRVNKVTCYFYGALAFLMVVITFLSFSRSAALATLCIFLGYTLGMKLRKRVLYLILVAFFIAFTATFSSSIITKVIIQHIAKRGSASLDAVTVFSTRKTPWEISYAAAQKGGMLGVGYGVSVGDDHFDMQGLRANNYGREKSNSQMAVIEETGWVGFSLYLLVIYSIYCQAFRVHRLLKSNQRVLMGIMLGAVSGMLVQSIFEGWWSAPGSPESVFFWGMVGTLLGYAELTRRLARHEKFIAQTQYRKDLPQQ